MPLVFLTKDELNPFCLICSYFNNVFNYSIHNPTTVCQLHVPTKKGGKGDWFPQNNQPLELLLHFVLVKEIVPLHIFHLRVIAVHTRAEYSA